MRRRAGTRQGQASLETAVAIAASIGLLVAGVKTWSWLDRSFIQRERNYQATRLQAGSVEPGAPNPYQQERLVLLDDGGGALSSQGGTGGTRLPACDAAEPFLDQYRTLEAELQRNQDEAQQIRADMQDEQGCYESLLAVSGSQHTACSDGVSSECEAMVRQVVPDWGQDLWMGWFWWWRWEHRCNSANWYYQNVLNPFNDQFLAASTQRLQELSEASIALQEQMEALRRQAEEACGEAGR